MKDARAIVGELKKFSAELAAKPRWLVINKSDLLPAAEAQKRAPRDRARAALPGPHFLISAATGEGTQELCEAVMTFLEEQERLARAHASSQADAADAPPDEA